jgi:cytochrome c-type biogenesis protein CcmH/NrfF
MKKFFFSSAFRAVWSRAAKTGEESAFIVPQGLKPSLSGAAGSTTKAAPFRQTRLSPDRSDQHLHLRGRAVLQGRVGAVRSLRALAPVDHRALQALILTAAVLLFVGAGPSTDARFKDLGHRMMCTCSCGQILLECNHVGCQSSDKMRDQLQAALDKGDNDDLILQGFVQDYGPTVIAAPTAKGFNRIAWIMPFFLLALGIAFVTCLVRAWKKRPEPVLADGLAMPMGSALDHFRAQARKETDL